MTKSSTFKDATTYRQNKEYSKALEIYHPLWKENPRQFDDWAGWSYGFCLAKNRQHQEALEVCRTLHRRYPKMEILNSLYGQCIYYTQFTVPTLPDVNTLKKAAEAICKLSPPINNFSFAPRAIFKLIKILMNNRDIKWEEIETWLGKLDPDLLDENSFSMMGQNGKKIEFASPLEEWYSAMIKVKAGLNQPNELLELLNVARKRGLKWHYSNDVWFARKEAFAYIQLGQRDKGEEILRKLTTQKRDWFLLSDLAEVIEDREEALILMARAALSFGEPALKIKLFNNLFNEIKNHVKYERETSLHLALIHQLRKENNWPIKEALLNEMQKRVIPNGHTTSKEIYAILIPFWQNLLKEKAVVYEGIIDTILGNNVAGFVKTNRKSYFFSVKDAKGIKGKIEKGTRVLFELADGFDRKKNVAKKVAVALRKKEGAS